MLKALVQFIEQNIKRVEAGLPIDSPPGLWGSILETSFSHHLVKSSPMLARDKIKKHVVVLVSGGLDSTVAWEMAKKVYGEKNVSAVYVRMETGYEDIELSALSALEIQPEIIETSIKHNWDRFGLIIPGRNLLFVLYAAQWLQEQRMAGEIWLSPTEEEIYQSGDDKSWAFHNTLNQFLKALYYPVRLAYPLTNMTKTDEVKWWIAEGLKIERLLKTRSCQTDLPDHCGLCQACSRRYIALVNNGLADRQRWTNDPRLSFDDPIVQERIKEAQNIVGRGFALSHEMSYKSAEQLLRALDLSKR